MAARDTIALINDIGNQIPDKSWILYLLELFNNQNIAIELTLSASLITRITLKLYLMV
jgi:hypothetical protein